MNKYITYPGILRGCFAVALALASCGGNTDSQSTTAPILTGKSCSMDADCGSGQVCGYAVADGCTAKGECLVYPIPGTAHCNSIIYECGCSGNKVAVACDFPSGYSSAPIKSTSALSCP